MLNQDKNNPKNVFFSFMSLSAFSTLYGSASRDVTLFLIDL